MPHRIPTAGFRRSAVVVIGAVALACSSCGPAPKKVFPVEGKLLYDGRPAKGAFVFFHPVGANDFTRGDQPRGVVGDDGTFHITTYNRNDGAPPGKYTVTVHWEPKGIGGDDEGDSPFHRYLTPDTSPLHAEVKEAPTVLEPFTLVVDGKQ
jgi:hypothetical protein